MRLVRDFKAFVLRGSVVDLAVGIVIGASFTVVVNSFVASFITPLIGAFGGIADFSQEAFTVNDSAFTYGRFVNDAISFLLTALVVFFLVVKPINALTSRSRREPPPDPTTKKCAECLSEIPIGARRCAFCTSEVRAPA